MIQNIKSIIFDIDGTLTEEISWHKLTEGLGASKEIHLQIYGDMKLGKLSYPEAKSQLIELWRATGNANKNFLKELFKSWQLKPQAKSIAEYLRSKYQICLISGSIDVYVEIVSDKLGVSNWYANAELIWDQNDELIDFNYHVDQAAKKVEQFQKYIADKKLKQEECVLVGDGDSDSGLFKTMTNSILVARDDNKEMNYLAKYKISKLEEIKELL